MEEYIKQYHSFDKKLIYNFRLGDGGVGDNVKFFMMALESCIKTNTRLYYKRNGLEIEKYIKLKHDIMYIDNADFEVVTPYMFYSSKDITFNIPINQVFSFSDEVIVNSHSLFPEVSDYISIHLRLGDKYLETDRNCVVCKEDVRSFSQKKIDDFIQENSNKNIFFCCDNNNYKLKLKEKYSNIIVTNCDIGHTSLVNTTKKQILDACTEFYILTNSQAIFAASSSGFSLIGSKFNDIPLIT